MHDSLPSILRLNRPKVWVLLRQPGLDMPEEDWWESQIARWPLGTSAGGSLRMLGLGKPKGLNRPNALGTSAASGRIIQKGQLTIQSQSPEGSGYFCGLLRCDRTCSFTTSQTPEGSGTSALGKIVGGDRPVIGLIARRLWVILRPA